MVRAPGLHVSTPNSSKRRMRTFLQHTQKFFKLLFAGLYTALAWITQPVRKLWYGVEVEQPKVVIPQSMLWVKFWKCAIHFVPVAATVVVAGLNIGTFFIGNEFQGYNTGYWQDFYRLALQVTAKSYELWTIASLGTVMMDMLRYQLLLSSSGLPLGILAAKTLFVDTTYLFSPEFRFGISGIDKWLRRWLLCLFIAACSLLALLVGPSLALLLSPQIYHTWPAGGATFHLVGTNESIWPSQLDARSIGGDHCRSPNATDLSLQLLNSSSCIWSGYASIAQWFQSQHQATNLGTIHIQDGVVERDISLHFYPLGVAAYGIIMAPCLYAEVLSAVWRAAIFNAKSAQPRTLKKSANLRYRAKGGSTSSMNSTLPVVRTTCFTNNSVSFADIVNQIEYLSDYAASLKATEHQYDTGTILGRRYSFKGTTYANSSRFAAIWLGTPEDEPIGTHIDGDSVTGRSSAYLNIQMPDINSSATGFHAACSIDARWVQSQILGAPVAYVGSDVTYRAPWFSFHDPSVFPALNDGNWRTVRLTTDWLNTLTPDLGGGENWNTLAYILSAMGLDNSTGLINHFGDVGITIATVVSALVTDGMSRSGYERNGGLSETVHDVEPLNYWPGPESWDPIIADKYKLPMAFYKNENTTEKTKIHWSVAVEGLGYRAEGTAYKLALSVLFLYLAIALAHTVWVLTTLESKQSRGLSTAWSSLTELITLALKSTPPTTTLTNASGGVKRYRSFKEPIRIRTASPQPSSPVSSHQAATNASGIDELEMIVGTDYVLNKHRRVVIGAAY